MFFNHLDLLCCTLKISTLENLVIFLVPGDNGILQIIQKHTLFIASCVETARVVLWLQNVNCKCSRRNSWYSIDCTRTWQMNFGIDRCQVRHFQKRQLKVYMTNSWVATNMLERGPAVVISMKITAQCSVKVKKIKQNKVWGVSRKANKKASTVPLYKSMVCTHFKHVVQVWTLCDLSPNT